MTIPRKPARPRPFLDEAGLYAFAVRTLARAMRTESDLRRLMRARVEPGDRGQATLDAVVARLKEQRYLDDKAFAETYARLRQENEKLGARRVRQSLQQKGVAPALASRTVEARYAATDEEALARQYLARKRMCRPEDEKDTGRILRRLVAAGFSTAVIYKILRQWDVPDEALAALDNLSDEPREE